MYSAAAALLAHSESLIDTLQAGAEDSRIANLVDERRILIERLTADIDHGEPVSALDADQIQRLDRVIVDKLTERRDEIARRLAEMRGIKIADREYGSFPLNRAIYLDKTG